ncbi:MAG: beta-propeller repeat protein [Solirubrobacterales bacterium]|nr:beta-propeller repeat protein [Solirubrobacterales bacterium]
MRMRQRGWSSSVSVGLTLATAGAVATPPAASAQTAWVTSLNNGRVISVDTVSGRQGPAVDVPGAGGAVITPDGTTVYVTGRAGVTPLSTATDTASAAIPVGPWPEGIAITPDGRTVLVVSGDGVIPISTVTNQPGARIVVDRPTGGVAVAPDGRTAYVVTGSSTLTPIDLSTGTTGAVIALAHPGSALAITPDGTSVLVGETESGTSRHSYLQTVDLRSGQAGPPVAFSDLEIDSVVITPDGRTAYVNEQKPFDGLTSSAPGFANVRAFDIPTQTVGAPLALGLGPGSSIGNMAVSGDGRTLFGAVPCNDPHCITSLAFAADTATGAFPNRLSITNLSRFPAQTPSPSGLVLVPDPSAQFTEAAGPAGTPTSFDAGGSSNAGGTVSSYSWQFGDGSLMATTASPDVTHIYARPGTYTVTLTTTSHGGCADTPVYNGRTASCTGSPTATRTALVTVPPPAPPAAHTGAARGLTQAGATLGGTVDAGGATAPSWHFEYGRTTRYGRTTPGGRLAPQRASASAHAVVGRLRPNTLYHYRLVVEAADGASGTTIVGDGTDATFRTRSTGTLHVQSRAARVADTKITLVLRCASSIPCRGHLSLATRTHTEHAHLVTISCGRGTLRLEARRTSRTPITVRPVCRSLLRDSPSHRLTATLTSTLSSGQRTLATRIRLRT